MLERLSAERSAQQMAWEQQLTSLQTDAERVKRWAWLLVVPFVYCSAVQ